MINLKKYKLNKIPFFSVIIPTFNSEDTILKTLKSVKKQTFKDFQIIIIDDGSKDETTSLINSFTIESALDITLIEKNNSGGPAAPRNLGISSSIGQWICFLDSDDYWFANKLNDAYIYLKNHEGRDVLTSNEIMIYNKKKTKLVYGPSTQNFYIDLLKKGNKLSTSATIVKKKFLVEKKIMFNEDINFSSVEDYDFWLQIAKQGGRFKFLNKFHGLYLPNKNSISKNRLQHFKNTRNVVNFHYSRLDNTNKKLLLFLTIKIRIFISFLLISFKERDPKLFFEVIRKIFSYKI